MRSWVSGTEDRPKVYRTFVRAFLFSQTTVLYPSLSISNRGAPIARIGRAEALPSLRIDADSVDQPHVLAQLGFTAKARRDRKSTRLNSSHRCISYAVFCLKKKNNTS